MTQLRSTVFPGLPMMGMWSRKDSRQLGRWSSRMLSAVGALLLHAALLQGIALGTAPRTSRIPEERGPGASAVVAAAGEYMTLVVIKTPDAASSESFEEIASRGMAPETGFIQMRSPDPAPLFDVSEASDPGADSVQAVGDPAAASVLFGRYTDQLASRIQVAWKKPRTAIEASSATPSASVFRCKAQITQDAVGYVKEIELVDCNGGGAWQRSLVRAIQRASPLPAPPDPSVFTQRLTLAFEGRSFVAGGDESQYEGAPRPPHPMIE